MGRFAAQRNKDMQHATEVLRAGQSVGQRNRALTDKALIGGAMALSQLGVAAGNSEASSQQHEENAHRDQMARAIENQTAMRDRDTRHMAESQQYEAPDHALGVGGRPTPSWLQESGEYDAPADLKSEASAARQAQQANMTAAGSAIGGYRTQDGLDQQDNQSSVLAGDMQYGQNLIKMGGMMSSLPRRQ